MIPISCGAPSPLVQSSWRLGGAPTATSLFVERKNNGLFLGDRPFYFAGANQYYFFYKNQKMTDDVFASAKALGLTVMRTWAFCEGSVHDGFCFQPNQGVYDEETFRHLDYTIAKASQTGMKLILSLANNWGGYDHFGGIDQYLSWAGGGLTHDDFYRNEKVKTLYRNYINYVLHRVNTITNVPYKDDPTILMWELMNEPRADDKESLYRWIDEMAGYIKGIDPHHLVTSGSEGGFSSDFYETHKSKNIDVASLHLYPESWGISLAAADSYLADHSRIAREKLNKPIFIGEFGLKASDSRPDVYRKWYDIMNRGDVNGALFWVLGGRQYGDPRNEGTLYPDYDGFTIYYPDSRNLCPIVQDYAAAMQMKQQNPHIARVSPDPELQAYHRQPERFDGSR